MPEQSDSSGRHSASISRQTVNSVQAISTPVPRPVPDALLHRTLQVATQGRLLAPPNPAVGCIICNAQGQILAEGHTQAVGGPHAEIMAMRTAVAHGHALAGATAYVSLEPCSHHGRTGPCCDALTAAGIQRVVAIDTDPNPRVAGQGFARLRAAGVQVHVLPTNDPLVKQARELNIGFYSRMLRKTPWVRMKVASSLDGRTALNNGASQWITGDAARADGHAQRARACAVLTGMGTVMADNPLLNVRAIATTRQPHLVLVDSRLETPLDARLFDVARTFYIYAAIANDAKKAALEARGATVIYLPGTQEGSQHKVDLAAMLRDLAQREINEVHVEAGHQLNGSLLRAGLVDELVTYVAPKLLAEGRGMAQLPPLADLNQALQLNFHAIDRSGPDLRIVARFEGRDCFL